MKRLLAKLPRSSSGSRELSARSSAAALPADILEVSMTDCASVWADFALVSSAICFSGASSGVFIKFRPLFGVLPEQAAGLELSAVSLARASHLCRAEIIGKTERSAAQWRKAGAENHAVIRILRRRHDLFLETARGLIDHQVNEAQ